MPNNPIEDSSSTGRRTEPAKPEIAQHFCGECANLGRQSERLCHTAYGMKMTMHIDEALLERVMSSYGLATKTEAVEMALREMDRRKRFKAYVSRPSPFTPQELADGVDPDYDLVALRAAEGPDNYRTKNARKRSR